MVEHSIQGCELVLRYSGNSSPSEVRLSLLQQDKYICNDEVTDLIADFNRCESNAVFPQILEEIASCVRIATMTNPQLRVAVVTAKPETMLQAEVSPVLGSFHYPIKLVDSSETARVWFKSTPLRSKHAAMLQA
ncbi:hypothetical protein [Propionivibrio dicarboxylicus]|uniref:Uncharacterized protein n=1 Tax=Propionivibrio dicarboxylicus TaxID=83767 RepID=A0A1G8ALZ0_9RHOO|nr:hypothetical protein [Propionivibrio dicarboxylicus]SDH21954.1 hypothetical protein SAMN05660652_01430 [Propionivibrio dicarboxylicus]